jgi:hypothetical protein
MKQMTREERAKYIRQMQVVRKRMADFYKATARAGFELKPIEANLGYEVIDCRECGRTFKYENDELTWAVWGTIIVQGLCDECEAKKVRRMKFEEAL